MNTVPYRLGEPRRLRGGRSARRIETLATLPAFWRLRGRKVLVAGGSDAAAWKAELLAAAGARVEVYAPVVGRVLEELIQESRSDRCIRVENRSWSQVPLDGAALAVGDFKDEEESSRFSSACRKAGVPVNVIDKPGFCDFQFGSIVNRGPLVVGISTDGAAPVLGQAIRRRIEALLPHFLADWARIAQLVRKQVTGSLAAGQSRRMFWERFVDRVFTGPPGKNAVERLLDDCRAVARGNDGNAGRAVLLASPDEADLLTIRAMRQLQGADLILHTRYVVPAVLELARREAMRRVTSPRDLSAAELRKQIGRGRAVVVVGTRPVIRDLERTVRRSGVPVEFA